MNYRITITKLEDNPNYKQEMEKYLEASTYNNRQWNNSNGVLAAEPRESFERNAFFTILDQEQFDAVKKAALEKF